MILKLKEIYKIIFNKKVHIEIIKVRDNKIWFRYEHDKYACYYISTEGFKSKFKITLE